MNETNKEEGKILYATILPILALVAVLLGAGYFLLSGEIKLPKFRKEATELTRLEGFPTIVSDVEVMEKQRVIITNETQLSEFLNKVDPAGKLTLKENINFDKESLIGVTTETNATYGYEIKIKKVTEDEETGNFKILVEETEPDDECMDEYDTVANIAIDLAVISKTDKELDFERIKNNVECETEESTSSTTE